MDPQAIPPTRLRAASGSCLDGAGAVDVATGFRDTTLVRAVVVHAAAGAAVLDHDERATAAARARACSGRAAVEAGRLSLPTGLLLDEGSARLTIGKGLCLLAVPNVETGQPLGAADPQPVDPGTA